MAISVDGNTIVGQGINPNGLTEAWIATYAEPVLASPVGVAISTGSLVSGELPEILDSDDQYLVIDPTFGPFRYQLAYTVDAISPTATSSTIEFNCESHTFNIVGTVEQKVELFNYLTGEFESIDTRLTTSNDSMVSIIVNGNPSRFVEAGTGAMQARLSYENSGSFWVFCVCEHVSAFRNASRSSVLDHHTVSELFGTWVHLQLGRGRRGKSGG